jgi:hypothetical protein
MTGPRPAGRPWTRAEDNQLRELLASGMKGAHEPPCSLLRGHRAAVLDGLQQAGSRANRVRQEIRPRLRSCENLLSDALAGALHIDIQQLSRELPIWFRLPECKNLGWQTSPIKPCSRSSDTGGPSCPPRWGRFFACGITLARACSAPTRAARLDGH